MHWNTKVPNLLHRRPADGKFMHIFSPCMNIFRSQHTKNERKLIKFVPNSDKNFALLAGVIATLLGNTLASVLVKQTFNCILFGIKKVSHSLECSSLNPAETCCLIIIRRLLLSFLADLVWPHALGAGVTLTGKGADSVASVKSAAGDIFL